MVCDRFRLDEVEDACRDYCEVSERYSRNEESTQDVRDARKFALDGFPDRVMSVTQESRSLLTASLAVTTVATTDTGVVRVQKKDNTARDDVSSALVLAAGAAGRESRRPPVGVSLTPV